ncbi:MAG: metallophosphoesterase [Planctomycetota bacterium]
MSRVLQLSDLHLGRMPEHDDQRCDIVVQTARDLAPDLIVISGDLCDDAPCQPQQITTGKSFVQALDAVAPTRVVPGNHDVGNKPGIEHDALTRERFDAWRTVFGDGWFREDLDGYEILGLNSQIAGSGWEEEQAQLRWLDDQLEQCNRAVVFMHMPLDVPACVDAANERRDALAYWPIDPQPRVALAERLTRGEVRLLCSGHLHNDAALPNASPPRRWCPSLSFGVNIPGVSGTIASGDLIGCLHHQLKKNEITSALIPVELPVSSTMTL